MSNKNLRDFIYLDVERVRSFVAQVNEGLPSERTRGSEHEAGATGSVEGSLPFIAKGIGETNYHYLRTQSETRSLHDFIFEEFFQSLKREDMVLEFTVNTPLTWTERTFYDGAFVLATGVFKFIDYQHTIKVFRMSSIVFDIAKKGIKETGKERHDKEAAIQRQATEFKKLPINEIADFINSNYDEDLIRVKIFPYNNDTSRFFIGNADRKVFRFPPVSIRNTYGAVVDANWSCLLQINRGVKHQPGTFVSTTGNEMEDAFERMVETTATISNLTHGVDFPAVAMTPIAIFRERNF